MKRIRKQWLFLAVSLGFLAGSVFGETEAEKFFQRANDFAAKNSLPRAKAEYEKALRSNPQYLDALYNLAVVCEKLGQKDEAITHCRRYVELKPNDPDAWTQLGVLLDGKGDAIGAEEAYRKAVTLDPKFGRAHHNLGVLLSEHRRLDESRKHLEAFLQLEEQAGRQTGEAYYSLGVLELRQGHVKEAKLSIQKALDVDPSVPFFNNAMGDVLLADHNPSMALAHYQRAIEKDSHCAPAYSGLGDAYRTLEQRDKAAAAYRKALEIAKDYPIVHYKLGLLFEATEPAQAIKHFENYLASGKKLEFQQEATARLDKLKQPKQP